MIIWVMEIEEKSVIKKYFKHTFDSDSIVKLELII